jgi:OOP family OmpA-OmpF porin
MSRFGSALYVGIVALGLGCASAPIPHKDPIAVTPPKGRLAISQAVTLLDASGSEEALFADARATLESQVAVMPDGSYQAAQIHFGGFERAGTGLAAFDRETLAAAARNAEFLEGTSPLYSVLRKDVAGMLEGQGGDTAVVLISDGRATDYAGRGGVEELTVEAARSLAEGRAGRTCYHAVQVGDDAAGAALLQSIAQVSDCGSFRNATSLGNASALQAFSREAYLGGAASPAIPAAGAGRDSDGDGIADAQDACPNSLAGAPVDARGCWTISNLEFAVNGAEIEAGFSSGLQEAIAVLAANPGVRVRVDGHTDSDGSPAYNQALSERRAAAVRDHLVSEGGLDPERFEVKGFGESKPAVPNDSAANKRRNRRVELTILD